MKHFLIILLAFSISSRANAQSDINNQLKDSFVKDFFQSFNINSDQYVVDSLYKYNAIGEDWIIDYKGNTTKYNSDGNPESVLYKFWDNNNFTWINKDSLLLKYYNQENTNYTLRKPWNREIKTWVDTTFYTKYNQKGNITKLVFKSWDYKNNKPNNSRTDSYSYNVNDLLTSKQSKIFNFGASAWGKKELKLYYYNGDNKIDTSIKKIWVSDIEFWQNSNRVSYKYNTQGYKIEKKEDVWDEPLSKWKNYHITVYEYNANNEISKEIIETWKSSEWISDEKTIYYYDNKGNKSKEERFKQVGGIDKNVSQRLYKYDINNNQIEFIYKTLDFSTDELVNLRSSTDEYDSNNNKTITIYKNWDKISDKWQNITKYQRYWSKINPNSISINPISNLKIYPNPTSGVLLVNNDNSFDIKIYNFEGKLLKRVSKSNKIDISELPNGIYLIETSSKNRHTTQKIIKE